MNRRDLYEGISAVLEGNIKKMALSLVEISLTGVH
jgi:hypothetical protein